MTHPVMGADEIRHRTQAVWDQFYAHRQIWKRSKGAVNTLRARLAFVLISKIYRQMYANTGIATDSARVQRSVRWARLMAIPCRRLFAGRPMPALTVPARTDADSSGRVPLRVLGRPSQPQAEERGTSRGERSAPTPP
jgi:hypothetical protein